MRQLRCEHNQVRSLGARDCDAGSCSGQPAPLRFTVATDPSYSEIRVFSTNSLFIRAIHRTRRREAECRGEQTALISQWGLLASSTGYMLSFATYRSNESGKVILPFLSNPKVTPDEPPCPSVANPL